MGIFKMFFANICVLVMFTYLLNLSYKVFFSRLASRKQYVFTTLWFILAGWVAMFFAFQIGDARFDLRYVPLIFGTLVFPSPPALFVIGAATGLLRLTFGMNAAAWAGCLNMVILGAVSAYLSVLFGKRPEWPIFRKTFIAVMSVNVTNIANIAIFGVIPARTYLDSIAPISFTVSVLLSFFFYLIIRDLEREANRMKELSHTNRLLRVRTADLDQARQELEQKAEQLAAASQYKSEFLANMSYELNTPLHRILELSQLQGDTATADADRRRHAERIHQSGQDLLSLVNDILDLSKVEAGKLEMAEEQVSLEDTLQTMDELFRPLAERNGVEFRITRSADAPDWISADPQRLSQILRNLLVHAFKYTDRGRVELSLAGGSNVPGNAEAVFQVKDTGVFLTPDPSTGVFESLLPEEAPSNGDAYGGSRLALALSGQLAGLLGGRLEVHSGEEGLCFTLTLPMQAYTAVVPERA